MTRLFREFSKMKRTNLEHDASNPSFGEVAVLFESHHLSPRAGKEMSKKKKKKGKKEKRLKKWAHESDLQQHRVNLL